MSEYTPTTDEVRNASAGSLNYITFDEFNRWLKQVKQESYELGLEHGREEGNHE